MASAVVKFCCAYPDCPASTAPVVVDTMTEIGAGGGLLPGAVKKLPADWSARLVPGTFDTAQAFCPEHSLKPEPVPTPKEEAGYGKHSKR